MVLLCGSLQGAAKALIFPVVQQFTEAFVQALQMPDGPSSDSGLKMEVLKVMWVIWDTREELMNLLEYA